MKYHSQRMKADREEMSRMLDRLKGEEKQIQSEINDLILRLPPGERAKYEQEAIKLTEEIDLSRRDMRDLLARQEQAEQFLISAEDEVRNIVNAVRI